MSAGRRPRTILLIALALWPAALVSAQAADHPPDTMEARLLACAACHGRQGQGTDNDYFPRLAGKPAGYLMNQLVAFRDGRRRYPPMNYLLEYISDPYLRQMAEYFAALHPPLVEQTVPAASAALLARGHALVTDGDPDHGVPPYSHCHGSALTGMGRVPGLLGCASYISAQLGAFRYGTRTAAEPDCMQVIAASLTEGDVKTVAPSPRCRSQPIRRPSRMERWRCRCLRQRPG